MSTIGKRVGTRTVSRLEEAADQLIDDVLHERPGAKLALRSIINAHLIGQWSTQDFARRVRALARPHESVEGALTLLRDALEAAKLTRA
jgi:hypothetical protein